MTKRARAAKSRVILSGTPNKSPHAIHGGFYLYKRKDLNRQETALCLFRAYESHLLTRGIDFKIHVWFTNRRYIKTIE
jgi:hypothetical protein